MSRVHEMLSVCRSSCREHYKEESYPSAIQVYGGLEDHVVDEFGFKFPICAENKGFTLFGRGFLIELIAQNKKQPYWVPKFTKVGFEKAQIPTEIYSAILTEYERLKSSPSQEHCSQGVINCEEIVSDEEMEESSLKEIQKTYMMLLSDKTLDLLEGGLKPLAEAWADVELIHTSTYGIRRYTNGSWLTSHVDRFNTHVISAILNIGQQVEEAWPLYIKDNDGRSHEVFLAPGQMVWYESARAVHGRPRPFVGEYYDNLFIHFKPVGSWYSQPFRLGKRPRSKPITLRSETVLDQIRSFIINKITYATFGVL